MAFPAGFRRDFYQKSAGATLMMEPTNPTCYDSGMPAHEIPKIQVPARALAEDGRMRRVGVEVEFGGMALDDIAGKIRACLGGVIEKHNDYAATLKDTRIGDVKVEFDASLFTDLKVRGLLKDWPLEEEAVRSGEIAGNWEKLMASAATHLVPFEVVFPPLEISRLNELEEVREALRDEAEGTGASLINAFGLHLNPEPPGTDTATILEYLRAFFCLYEELVEAHRVDAARRISPFIDPFPKAYVMRVLDREYAPDRSEFTADYLDANPTRNRPLDLLPLLTWLDEDKVRARLPEEKIGKRPTFHYRLPDCRMDQPEWTISAEWNRWARVEQLAASPELANTCARALRQLRGRAEHPLRRPRVGVTGPDKGGFPAWFFTRIALFRAGARAVRLRPGKFPAGKELPPLDAWIIGGGADVDPGRYLDGFEALRDEIDATEAKKRNFRWWMNILLAPVIYLIRSLFSLSAGGVDPSRDEFEDRCIKQALGDEQPLLGICRGAQLINIHFNGTLHLELEDFYGETGNLDTVFPRKRVTLDRETRFYRVFDDDSILVNSLHNQAVDRLGEGLRICARDHAGVVQAIEKTSHPFLIGVQWHPEYLPLVRTQQKLFRELVRCAKC